MQQQPTPISLKQQVYDRCQASLQEQTAALRSQLASLREMIAAETKSTAGDKYETARAMIHIEQEQINRQLAAAQKQLLALAQIDWRIRADNVIRGSLVHTSNGVFFLGISLGKLIVDDQLILVISPQSPLGAKLLGLRVGHEVEVNNKRYQLTAIE